MERPLLHISWTSSCGTVNFKISGRVKPLITASPRVAVSGFWFKVSGHLEKEVLFKGK